MILYVFIVSSPSFFFSQTGSTALMLASRNGHLSAVRALLRHGAAVNVQNKVIVSIVWVCLRV